MKILLISYGIKEYDGRLSELYKVASNIGDVTIVCVGENKGNNKNENIVLMTSSKYLSIKLYLSFILLSLKTAYKMKEIDILVSDNLFASLPALLIRTLFKPKKIIQDVRELYFYKDIKNWTGKFLCKFETILMKKADVILCANHQRSKIMFEYYNLKNPPIVFENIRFLTDSFDSNILDDKYKKFFNFDVNIVSTGGISVKRNIDKLVYSMTRIPSNYGLYIIGDGTKEDMNLIEEIIRKNNLKNITIINKVPLSELRYILQQCDIGIVSYHKNDLNNRYCASGKVYEYLAEGLPIVTSENEPLKEFCGKYKVGVADDNFYNGILEVSNNISGYKNKVESFISGVSVQKYNSETANKILGIIGNSNYNEKY
ncbi:glycosyltransferase involved in cell wall biosynthesis [Solibacillus kalamii]|uniref:Glycosyl transferase family 1 domain-containing protein n=1 Tax=Solibacillus kalamii TaxID=1748298 RepID=A0ABX3ZKZ8_9BACL|nr:glycosyltransferase [Solibacillus kalamii]MBM7665257.1 glycosyltransferase involved in cell wall biosynthesis [Solibacillus kalamii]OUZ40384.1 hypothetical protein CBM15_00575 [Solibacillus kalamii]